MTNHILNELNISLGDINLSGIGIEEIIEALPPELYTPLKTLIIILKTVGIVFILYLIFLLISSILSIRRSYLIRQIYRKVNEIDKKLDKVFQKKEKHHKKKK